MAGEDTRYLRLQSLELDADAPHPLWQDTRYLRLQSQAPPHAALPKFATPLHMRAQLSIVQTPLHAEPSYPSCRAIWRNHVQDFLHPVPRGLHAAPRPPTERRRAPLVRPPIGVAAKKKRPRSHQHLDARLPEREAVGPPAAASKKAKATDEGGSQRRSK